MRKPVPKNMRNYTGQQTHNGRKPVFPEVFKKIKIEQRLKSRAKVDRQVADQGLLYKAMK